MPRIIIRAATRREIKKHGIYLEKQAGRAATDHFLAALDATFEELTRMPRMAPLGGFTRPALKQLRRFPV